MRKKELRAARQAKATVGGKRPPKGGQKPDSQSNRGSAKPTVDEDGIAAQVRNAKRGDTVYVKAHERDWAIKHVTSNYGARYVTIAVRD